MYQEVNKSLYRLVVACSSCLAGILSSASSDIFTASDCAAYHISSWETHNIYKLSFTVFLYISDLLLACQTLIVGMTWKLTRHKSCDQADQEQCWESGTPAQSLLCQWLAVRPCLICPICKMWIMSDWPTLKV